MIYGNGESSGVTRRPSPTPRNEACSATDINTLAQSPSKPSFDMKGVGTYSHAPTNDDPHQHHRDQRASSWYHNVSTQNGASAKERCEPGEGRNGRRRQQERRVRLGTKTSPHCVSEHHVDTAHQWQHAIVRKGRGAHSKVGWQGRSPTACQAAIGACIVLLSFCDL